jgi:predicted methyltransferase
MSHDHELQRELQRERDDLRAEIERLRGLLATCAYYYGPHRQDSDAAQWAEIQKAIKDAYPIPKRN